MAVSLYQLFSVSIILIFSLILSVQDLKQQSVKLYVQALSVLCALLCQLIFLCADCWIYILSGLIMGGFYFAVRKITKGRLGMADVWFGFFQGLFLRPVFIPVCLGIEAVAALIVINKKWKNQRFAFIPFMSFALTASWIIQLFIK